MLCVAFGDLRGLHRLLLLGARDLDGLLPRDLLRLDLLLLFDLGQFDLPLLRDHRLLRLALPVGAHLGDLGRLLRLRLGLLALQFQDLLPRLHVLEFAGALGLALQVVALDRGRRRDLGDLAFALRVEDVVVAQLARIGLVQFRDGDRFQQQTVRSPGRS